MQTFCRSFHGITSQLTRSKIMRFTSSEVPPMPYLYTCAQGTATHSFQQPAGSIFAAVSPKSHSWNPLMAENKLQRRNSTLSNNMICCGIIGNNPPFRCMTTVGHPEPSLGQCSSTTSPETDQPKHIKFKRLSKTAKHIMNILDKEEVEKVQVNREIPDIRPGYIIQLKVEVPENKRRVSVLKGIVIARRNAGLNTTFRLRRLVAGVGVESVFPLYSPNIKEMKVLEKKKVRRAKLYYLRDRMNALKK